MPGIVLVELVALVLLLVFSAFFSSAEAVFFSLNPLDMRRIDKRHAVRGAQVRAILSDAPRLLSSILIGNTIVNTVAAAVGYSLCERWFPDRGERVAVFGVTALLLIFGEIGPKRLGLLYAHGLAVAFVPLVGGLIRLVTPVRLVVEGLTRKCEPLFRPRGLTLSEEEFETVVDIGREEGVLNEEELGMVKAVIRLDDMKASDIMTPRVDLVGLDVAEDPARALQVALSAKLNFLLLYRDSIDNVESLLDLRKFLLDPEHRLERAQVEPLFVPEGSSLTRLLGQFQSEGKRLAVVVDQYGGTAGVVTRGDILEEISGEVLEEMSKPRPLFQKTGPNRWLVDATYRLDDLNRRLRLRLESEDADRLGGWIVGRIGHIPEPNEVIEAQGCRVTVMQTRRHRVTVAQVERLAEEAPGP